MGGVADVGRPGEYVFDAERRRLRKKLGARPNQPDRRAEVLEEFPRDAVVASEVEPGPLEPQRRDRDDPEPDEQAKQGRIAPPGDE